MRARICVPSANHAPFVQAAFPRVTAYEASSALWRPGLCWFNPAPNVRVTLSKCNIHVQPRCSESCSTAASRHSPVTDVVVAGLAFDEQARASCCSDTCAQTALIDSLLFISLFARVGALMRMHLQESPFSAPTAHGDLVDSLRRSSNNSRWCLAASCAA